jgi:hypothetical protein
MQAAAGRQAERGPGSVPRCCAGPGAVLGGAEDAGGRGGCIGRHTDTAAAGGTGLTMKGASAQFKWVKDDGRADAALLVRWVAHSWAKPAIVAAA